MVSTHNPILLQFSLVKRVVLHYPDGMAQRGRVCVPEPGNSLAVRASMVQYAARRAEDIGNGQV